MSTCSLYNRLDEESEIIVDSYSNSLKQATLLSSPSLVFKEELFAQKSDLRIRKSVYFACLIWISTVGIVALKSNRLFSLLSIYVGHRIES